MTDEKICYASERTMARNLGVSRRTISRELQWLVDHDYLERRFRLNVPTCIYVCTYKTSVFMR